MTIVVVVMLGVGACSVYHALRVTFRWPRALARIAGYRVTRSEHEPHGQKFYHPVVRFETADGLPVIATSDWGSWRKPWPVGHVVFVYYNPANPRWVEIGSIACVWGIPLTLAGLISFLTVFMWLWNSNCNGISN